MRNKNPSLMFVVASRPNFMKVSPLIRETKKARINFSILYIGQHKNELMSDVFFKECQLPPPNFTLNLQKKEKMKSKTRMGLDFVGLIPKTISILKKANPKMVVVVGDVVASAYIALIAKLLRIPLAHVEAGLRSFNRKMPEEKARKIIDKCSSIFFTTEEIGNKNLSKMGVKKEKIFLVGNVMIDNLVWSKNKIRNNSILKKLKIKKREYGLLTIHRAETINNKIRLIKIFNILNKMCKEIKIIFPLHPRTKEKIKSFKLEALLPNLKVISPLGYFDLITLQKNAKFVLTDSGGLQGESTFFQIPCLTLRQETEHLSTIKEGSNTLVGFDGVKIKENINKILKGKYKKGKTPEFWDGKSSKRIIKILKNNLKTYFGLWQKT
jgi:UDP-N-acetylglucosamine 2-epimerase (non-hydrolysing)